MELCRGMDVGARVGMVVICGWAIVAGGTSCPALASDHARVLARSERDAGGGRGDDVAAEEPSGVLVDYRLNRSRLAVLFRPDTTPEARAEVLDETQSQPDAAASGELAGGDWILWRSAISQDGLEDALSHLGELAARPEVAFVSPVFLDRQNAQFAIGTHIVVRMASHPRRQKDERLTALTEEFEIVTTRDVGKDVTECTLRSAARTAEEVLAQVEELAARPGILASEPEIVALGVRDPGVTDLGRGGWVASLLSRGLRLFQVDGGGLVQPTGRGGPCPNGGFASESFSQWKAFAGSNNFSSGVTLSPTSPLPDRHVITSGAGYDPQVGGTILPVVNPLGPPHSVRLGNEKNGAQAEALEYTMLVTPQNMNFVFNYAVVLQDGGHEPARQPFFEVRVKWWLLTVHDFKVAAKVGDPYFHSAGHDGVVYKPWTCYMIDLSSFVGKTVTIRFTTADCTDTGHFGYAYIDSLCEAYGSILADFIMPTDVCVEGGPIIADGTASVNETDVFWSVEESDANFGRPNPLSEVMQWFPAQQAGPLDLIVFMASHGKTLKCDSYYRVKLAVRNDCIGWRETVKLLHTLPCPDFELGPDRDICCTNPQPVTIGPLAPPNPPAIGYLWHSNPAGFSSTSPTVTVNPTGVTTYTLVATGANGCTHSDSVQVRIDAPIHVDLDVTHNTAYPCQVTSILLPTTTTDTTACVFTPVGPNSSHGRDYPWTYLWSTGATSPSLSVDPVSSGTYSVSVSNACYTATDTITVQGCPPFTGPFPDLIFPSAFTPNGDGLNDVFVVFELGLGQNQVPAYGALSFRFTIYDRWGNQVAQTTANTGRCDGFYNGQIRWNGTRDGSSAIVQEDVYVWTLELKRCPDSVWERVRIDSVTVIR